MTVIESEAQQSHSERPSDDADFARLDPVRAAALGGRRALVGPLAALAGTLLVLGLGTGYRYDLAGGKPGAGRVAYGAASPAAGSVPALLAELRAKRPLGAYVVIDRVHNRLTLRRGEEVLLEAIASTGSGAILRDPASDRQWVFDTPTGLFHVRSRIASPAWRKPDWAFVEVGEPVPADPAARIELGSLGEYALDLGEGYLIHGTLYERLLGRSVTHGCIRLGRDDLRRLWRATEVGTPVYIF